MHMENSQMHENSKDSEATFGIRGILDKGEKWGNKGLWFQKWDGQFTSSWGRVEDTRQGNSC